MVFFADGTEVEEINISKMDAKEINELLNSKGFYKNDGVIETPEAESA